MVKYSIIILLSVYIYIYIYIQRLKKQNHRIRIERAWIFLPSSNSSWLCKFPNFNHAHRSNRELESDSKTCSSDPILCVLWSLRNLCAQGSPERLEMAMLGMCHVGTHPWMSNWLPFGKLNDSPGIGKSLLFYREPLRIKLFSWWILALARWAFTGG